MMIERDRKNWPKISIVTPSYNQGQYIEDTILSIIEQNYPNLEYIIIDGGSTDNTVEIIKKYEKYISYWVSEPDDGQSHAINKGLARCTGDIFNWVNSDDYLESNALHRIALGFIQHDVEVVAGYRRKFTDNYTLPVDLMVDRLRLEHDVEKSIINIHFIQLPTFFALNVIKDIKGLNQQLHYVMDTEMWMRYLLQFGQDKILLINEVLANYRLHSDSKTVSAKDKFKVEWSKVSKVLYSQLDIEEDVQRQMNLVNSTHLFTTYKLVGVEVSSRKLKQYIYERALVHYIGVTKPILFLKSLKKIIKYRSFSWETVIYIYSTFILPRIKARL